MPCASISKAQAPDVARTKTLRQGNASAYKGTGSVSSRPMDDLADDNVPGLQLCCCGRLPIPEMQLKIRNFDLHFVLHVLAGNLLTRNVNGKHSLTQRRGFERLRIGCRDRPEIVRRPHRGIADVVCSSPQPWVATALA